MAPIEGMPCVINVIYTSAHHWKVYLMGYNSTSDNKGLSLFI